MVNDVMIEAPQLRPDVFKKPKQDMTFKQATDVLALACSGNSGIQQGRKKIKYFAHEQHSTRTSSESQRACSESQRVSASRQLSSDAMPHRCAKLCAKLSEAMSDAVSDALSHFWDREWA